MPQMFARWEKTLKKTKEIGHKMFFFVLLFVASLIIKREILWGWSLVVSTGVDGKWCCFFLWFWMLIAFRFFFILFLYNNFIPYLCDFKSQSFFSAPAGLLQFFFLQGNNRNDVVLKRIFSKSYFIFVIKKSCLQTMMQKINIVLLVNQQLQWQVCICTGTECLWGKMSLTCF